VSRYSKLRIHEVPDGTRKSKVSETVLREEATALLKAVPANARLVALVRGGDRCGSRRFASRLSEWRESGRDLVFLIGGAYGLDTTVRERCEVELSLSDMTFPHEVARLMLLEQMYRGNTILQGEPYHKGD
jgi:23S rRNA (pseudouridine1915-N3)-methyltransferase